MIFIFALHDHIIDVALYFLMRSLIITSLLHVAPEIFRLKCIMFYKKGPSFIMKLIFFIILCSEICLVVPWESIHEWNYFATSSLVHEFVDCRKGINIRWTSIIDNGEIDSNSKFSIWFYYNYVWYPIWIFYFSNENVFLWFLHFKFDHLSLSGEEWGYKNSAWLVLANDLHVASVRL